jgi:hypothetical protein
MLKISFKRIRDRFISLRFAFEPFPVIGEIVPIGLHGVSGGLNRSPQHIG